VWESAANSALAVRHGDDHPSFSLVNNPAIVIMREFSKTGVLPAARNDSRVSVYTPRMQMPKTLGSYKMATGALVGDQDSGSEANITGGTFLP